MYLDGWRPTKPGEALRFGSLIHTGLEGWWKDDGSGRLAAAIKAIEGRGSDDYEQAAAEALLVGYDRQWGEDEQYEVLGVEETFFVPLINPESGAASRTWTLAGKLDGRLRNRATDAPVILEHKTTQDNIADPVDLYWTKLAMDAQVSQYFIGAGGLGFAAEGCLYDVLLRPRQEPLKATPMEKRKYKKGTGALYANQRECDETPDEYRQRVWEDIEAHPEKYFQRREVARTENDIREYLGDVWAEGRMMREAELAERAPRNPESCHRFGTCPFWDACAYGVRPGDHPEAYVKLDNVHPELDLQEVY
jgi:hypothetical protein